MFCCIMFLMIGQFYWQGNTYLHCCSLPNYAFVRENNCESFNIQAALVIRGGYVPRKYHEYQNRKY